MNTETDRNNEIVADHLAKNDLAGAFAITTMECSQCIGELIQSSLENGVAVWVDQDLDATCLGGVLPHLAVVMPDYIIKGRAVTNSGPLAAVDPAHAEQRATLLRFYQDTARSTDEVESGSNPDDDDLDWAGEDRYVCDEIHCRLPAVCDCGFCQADREVQAEIDADRAARDEAEQVQRAIEQMIKADNRKTAAWAAVCILTWVAVAVVKIRKARKAAK